MAHTLASSIVEVRNILNEKNAVFWGDTEISDWIKEGTRIFSSKTLMVEDTDGLDPLIEAQLMYSASDETWISDIIEPYAAVYFNGTNRYKGLIKIHPRMIGNLALGTAGPPKYYCMHDRNIYVFPLTSAAVVAAGASIAFLYSKETEDIEDITDEYYHLPIVYAAAKAKQKDQKYAEANSLFAQFYQEVNFERQDKHAREVDSLDKFKVPIQGGGSEGSKG
jgi:ABC-type glycerol-3-phosphate transport system substrate-binding protein